MNELVALVSRVLGRHIPSIHIPYWIGMCGGLGFDLLSKISRKKLPISSVRVRKFCATTQFDAMKMQRSGFKVPYTLEEGLSKTLRFEFINPPKDDIIFKSE